MLENFNEDKRKNSTTQFSYFHTGWSIIKEIESFNIPFRVGVARSCLAVCTLLNLAFNSYGTLRIVPKSDLTYKDVEFYSLFHVFKSEEVSFIIAVIILLSVLSGYYPRITCYFHFWVSFSFIISADLIEGGDQVASIVSLWLCPLLMFDKRVNHWSKSNFNREGHFFTKSLAFFSLWIIKIQIAIIYFNASMGKLETKEWSNGTAVYYWFNHPVFGLNKSLLSIAEPFLLHPIGVALLTWGAIAIELFIAFSIFSNSSALKKATLITGITLHFSFIVVFGLWSFFFAMLGGLLLFTYVNSKAARNF